MKVEINNDSIKVLSLDIEIAKTGHITNTYVVIDKKSNTCMVIDPAFDAEKIIGVIQQENVKPVGIIITHAHADHIGALEDLRKYYEYNISIYIHALDKEGLNNDKINESEKVDINLPKIVEENIIELNDNDEILIGDTELKVVHTPGHTKGSIIIYLPSCNVIFSGDTIFHNTYGRTDLYWSDKEKMGDTLDKIFNVFDNEYILPGHDKSFKLSDSKKKIRLVYSFKEQN